MGCGRGCFVGGAVRFAVCFYLAGPVPAVFFVVAEAARVLPAERLSVSIRKSSRSK